MIQASSRNLGDKGLPCLTMMLDGRQELYRLWQSSALSNCVCQMHFSGRQQFYRVPLRQSPLTDLPTGTPGRRYIARSSVSMVHCIKFIPSAFGISELKNEKDKILQSHCGNKPCSPGPLFSEVVNFGSSRFLLYLTSWYFWGNSEGFLIYDVSDVLEQNVTKG